MKVEHAYGTKQVYALAKGVKIHELRPGYDEKMATTTLILQQEDLYFRSRTTLHQRSTFERYLLDRPLFMLSS